MLDPLLLTYLGVAALLTITPGADMAFIASTTLRHGRRPAFFATLGIVSGLLVHAGASALGVSLILAQSATAFEVLKVVGAAYLLYLGARAIWDARGTPATVVRRTPSGLAAAPDSLPPRRAFLRGLLNNVLNPKIAVFYLAFLPQFLAPGQDVFLGSLFLAGLHGVLGIAWLAFYAYLVHRLGDVLRGPKARASLERVTGGVLAALGVRLLLEKAPSST